MVPNAFARDYESQIHKTPSLSLQNFLGSSEPPSQLSRLVQLGLHNCSNSRGADAISTGSLLENRRDVLGPRPERRTLASVLLRQCASPG